MKFHGFSKHRPLLSIVVVFYKMQREAPRTLYSLSREYQRDIGNLDYEVMALDHGSPEPLDRDMVQSFGSEFSLQRVDTRDPSPIKAINATAAKACGEHLMINIDGARILSPGLLSWTAAAAELYPDAFVHTLAWHLGPDLQNKSMLKGYNQETEDRLLAESGWEKEGYNLFRISTLAASSGSGFFSDLAESNCFSLPRKHYLDMGGMHPGFRSPGAGIANLDFYNRSMTDPGLTPVRLLGEGTFHQIHGGVATSTPIADHPWQRYQEEYEGIYGQRWEIVKDQNPVFLGRINSDLADFLCINKKD